MPTKTLNAVFFKNLKPPASGRVEYFDSKYPGLALRITSNDARSWCVFYRINGRLVRYTIGPLRAFNLDQAREAAGDVLRRKAAGADPVAEQRAKRKAASEDNTFGGAVELYLEQEAKALKSYPEYKRLFERDVLPHWRNRPLASITKGDVIALVDGIAAPVQANRVCARIGRFFRWCVSKDRLTASPADGVERPHEEHSRDRVLTDVELVAFWKACDEEPYPFGPLFKVLLLTAQRREEVSAMQWNELNFETKTWTLSRERTKSDRIHDVQLSDPVIKILQALPKVGRCPFVFTTTGKKSVVGHDGAKARVEKRMPAGTPNWRLHDLRRTAATGMAQLKIAPHVADRILNHQAGGNRGVAGVYNRFEYAEERRAALAAWASRVTSLVEGKSDTNVVAFQQVSAA